ncbi:MAG: hypothetical protein ACK5NT_08545 [Pyrinomonadaceae bacterium]
MKNYFFLIAVFVFAGSFYISGFAQEAPTPAKLTRTTELTKSFEFGSGGTISVIGAPLGSVNIEGWNNSEVEVTTEVIVQATTDEDLRLLAEVCGSLIEDSLSQLKIKSVGTNDKKYLKQVNKNFPKRLRGVPYTVNYKIKVPVFSDLIIDGGIGNLSLKGVEGTFRINYLESNARLQLQGGTVQTTIGNGSVDVSILNRSWRGRFADIQLAKGDMHVLFPENLNANVKLSVLAGGKIENKYEMLKPVKRTVFTDTAMDAIAGNGGADLVFKVGNGNLFSGSLEKVAVK